MWPSREAALAAILVLINERVGYFVSGFLAGGYYLAEYYAPGSGLLPWLPFVIGLRVFRTRRDLEDLFDVLCRCALLYAPFCMVELVMSPQFHRWVYGYHQHSFLQQLRGSIS